MRLIQWVTIIMVTLAVLQSAIFHAKGVPFGIMWLVPALQVLAAWAGFEIGAYQLRKAKRDTLHQSRDTGHDSQHGGT